jgi:hypothetical protein
LGLILLVSLLLLMLLLLMLMLLMLLQIQILHEQLMLLLLNGGLRLSEWPHVVVAAT